MLNNVFVLIYILIAHICIYLMEGVSGTAGKESVLCV